MSEPNIPDNCPTTKGEECPVLEEHETRNKRRRGDSWQASLARIAALLGALAGGASGTAWYMRATPTSAQSAVDATAREEAQKARQELAVFQADIRGDIRVLRQQQEQVIEALREMRDEARRGRR